jgi:hypothetical protein
MLAMVAVMAVMVARFVAGPVALFKEAVALVDIAEMVEEGALIMVVMVNLVLAAGVAVAHPVLPMVLAVVEVE